VDIAADTDNVKQKTHIFGLMELSEVYTVVTVPSRLPKVKRV
jgi:hypothetical protein